MSSASRGGGRRRHDSEHPHPIDVHVGSRVRLRRTLLGMSQEKLGDAIGLTFQQVQKYERGTNRIGASRLFELSRVLDVPVQFFFDDMSAAVMTAGFGEAPQEGYEPAETNREMLELVRIYQRIGDPNVRRRLFDLARAIAQTYFPGERD